MLGRSISRNAVFLGKAFVYIGSEHVVFLHRTRLYILASAMYQAMSM